MANDSGGPGNGLLYGLLAALCAVVIGGGYYIYLYNQSLFPVPHTAEAPVPQAIPTTAPEPAAPPATPGGPSASQLAQARDAIANAQQLARRGDFSGAEASLQHADRIIPGFAETTAARSEIAELRKARGDERRDRDRDNRVAALVEAARAAIGRRHYDAADRALDEAERIDARDPTVKRARNELLEAASRPDRREDRN